MRLIAVLALAFVTVAAPASADEGRALLDTGLRTPVANADASGAQVAVALPDGGALLFAGAGPNGIVGTRMAADGSRDTTYRARIAVAGQTLFPTGALLRPDGRTVVTAARLSTAPGDRGEILVAQLTEAGALDPFFGTGGIAGTGLSGLTRPALAPDGTVAVTGTDAERHWSLATVSTTGAVTARQVPGSIDNDSGYPAVAIGPDGRVTLAGVRGRRSLVARLLPDGSPDPGWGGGAPVVAPVHVRDFTAAPDGSVVVLGMTRVARLRPDGAVDAAYGRVEVEEPTFARLLAERGGGVLVYRSPAQQPHPAALPDLVIDRIDAEGVKVTVALNLPFGGGASLLGAAGPLRLRQSGFAAGEMVRRPDDSYLVAGGVELIQYVGEGMGFSSARHAVVALTPALELDRTFGPAQSRPRVAVRPGRLEPRRNLLRLHVRANAPGLLSVRVRDRHGRLLAAGLPPVHRTGRQTVRVRTTARGRRLLRRRTTVRADGRFRDLVAVTVRVRGGRAAVGG